MTAKVETIRAILRSFRERIQKLERKGWTVICAHSDVWALTVRAPNHREWDVLLTEGHPLRNPPRGWRGGLSMLPEELRTRRIRLGLSVIALAARSGLAENTIYRKERGDLPISEEQAATFERVFDSLKARGEAKPSDPRSF